MYNKIKEFNRNFSNIFFLIGLVIIIAFLIFQTASKRNYTKECTVPNNVVNNSTNYSYKIKYLKEDIIYDINVKRHNSKYLISVKENDEIKTYYFNYTDLLIKNSSDIFVRYNGKYIIDEIDNKLLFLDYINDISLNSKVTKINDRTCYINIKNNLSLCINIDESIELSKDDYKLIYTIEEVGSISDFDLDIDLDYEEEITE